jgi:hypothetical protein
VLCSPAPLSVNHSSFISFLPPRERKRVVGWR